MHQTIKKVSGDFESLKFNTAIAAMMSLVNDFYRAGKVTRAEFSTLLILLNPVAPHMTEELWALYFGPSRIYQQSWPQYDEAKTVEQTVEIALQMNGKMRGTLVSLSAYTSPCRKYSEALPTSSRFRMSNPPCSNSRRISSASVMKRRSSPSQRGAPLQQSGFARSSMP